MTEDKRYWNFYLCLFLKCAGNVLNASSMPIAEFHMIRRTSIVGIWLVVSHFYFHLHSKNGVEMSTHFLNISLPCYISVPSRGFIKHRRLENSPSTTHNSPVKFQWGMAIFYLDKSDMDTLCHFKKKLLPEMSNFSA